MIGRVTGWIIFLAGLVRLAQDVVNYHETGHWAPVALGKLWYDFNRSSLNLVQAVVQRYIHPFLWDPIILSILLCWTFAVLMVLGLLILAISTGRRQARLSRHPS